MKNFILFLICCSSTVFGQITNQLKSDSSDIYIHAFNQYCEQVIKYSSNVSTIYVEKGKFYCHLLPDKVKDLEIKKVSNEDILKACKHGVHKYITVIIPLLNRNNIFYVGIIPFKVFAEKKRLHYVNEGGTNFNYSFNNETGQFVFIDSIGGNPKME